MSLLGGWLESRCLQRWADRDGLRFWHKLLVLRHDVSTHDKMRRLFRRGEDPYHYRDSPYERERLEGMLALLAGRSYERALEVGCAEGIFTGSLAPLCKRLVALDISRPALERARKAVPAPHVEWIEANARQWQPEDRFDLIVLAEFVFYLGDPTKGPAFEAAFEKFYGRVVSWMQPGARLLLGNAYGTQADLESREDYARRFERRGLKLIRKELICRGPHDKSPLRTLLYLLEK